MPEPAGEARFAAGTAASVDGHPAAKAPPQKEPPKKPQQAPRPKPGAHSVKPAHQAAPARRGGTWMLGRIYGVVMAVAVLALVGTFYFVPRQETASAYAPVYDQAGEIAVADPFPVELEAAAVEAPAPAPESAPASAATPTAPVPDAVPVQPAAPARPSAKAVKPPDFDPSLQLGVIAIPDVGMRAAHSLEAGVLSPRLKKGEKVAVLKRYAPATGPTWIKVQTKSGKTGWVFASVLQEKKSKGK